MNKHKLRQWLCRFGWHKWMVVELPLSEERDFFIQDWTLPPRYVQCARCWLTKTVIVTKA